MINFTIRVTGTRKYIPCLCASRCLSILLVRSLYNNLDVYNKIDSISLEQTDKLAREPNTVVISCEMDLKSANIFVLSLTLAHRLLCSLDYLIDRIWDELRLVKIYTKKRGAHPDLSDPICLRRGATIEAISCFLCQRFFFDFCTNRMFVMGFIDLLLQISDIVWSGEILYFVSSVSGSE